MPELPEVEIARENLERWLVGRTIRRASTPDPILRGGQPRRRLEQALTGARATAVSRRGKFLLVAFGPRRSAVVAHLGMTGKFLRLHPSDEAPRFVRVELGLARGERVVLCDARRLGQFRLLDSKEARRLSALGLEPLSPELDGRRLHQLTLRSSQPIKLFLMDQKKLAGIGNIQAAEGLFRAGIHPVRPARQLSSLEAANLSRSIRRSLRSEIAHYHKQLRESSDTPRYLHEGEDNVFLVYGRRGEPCPRCESPIERIVQAGRSSYYCPSCQPEIP
jgi:formamidopyrimidine-DNA glycosylase